MHVSSGDVEPYQVHNARRARVDVQHTALGLCIQHDRACHRRLEDDAPGDAELGAEGVGAGGEENAVDSSVGECTGQAGAGTHLGERAAVGTVGATTAIRILRSGSAIVAPTI